MAPPDNKTEYKSYAHGGLFEIDDRHQTSISYYDLDEMLKQIHKIGHPADTHFLYNHITREAYKRREDLKTRELFKKMAIEYISVFSALRPALYTHSGRGANMELIPLGNDVFQHLAMVYTEEGQYGKAIGVCEMAIEFESIEGVKDDFMRRIERIKKKAAKQGTDVVHCDRSELDAPDKDRLIADIYKGYKFTREREFVGAKAKGYDLIFISMHPTDCPKCKPFQGRTFSISGKDPDFPPLSKATSGGLFHEGCHHLIEISREGTERKLERFEKENRGKKLPFKITVEVVNPGEPQKEEPSKHGGIRKWLGI